MPVPGLNVPACLRRHLTNISGMPALAEGLDCCPGATRRSSRPLPASGATFRSPAETVCPYDPCPVIIGKVVLWRERSHITRTFSRQLAPLIRRFVQQALDGPP